MQELDLDTHHFVVVLAALVRAIVTASAAVRKAADTIAPIGPALRVADRAPKSQLYHDEDPCHGRDRIYRGRHRPKAVGATP